MKQLKLINSEEIVLVDDQDFERLQQFKWYMQCKRSKSIGRCTYTGYKTRHISLPSEIFQTSGIMYDHIDRNPLNNVRTNLRPVSYQENGWNRSKSKNNKTGVPGVCVYKKTGQFRVQISYKGMPKHIGYFNTLEEAKQAREKAVQQYYRIS